MDTDPTPASYHWLIDILPPDTTITSAPTNPSDSVDAAFEFTSETGATFECRNDGDAYGPCLSGDIFGPYGDGEHTFEVRAIDTAGNPGPTPASYTWTIDTTPGGDGAVYVTAPAGAIASGPTFEDNDILRWDGTAWQVWFDGAAAQLQQGNNQVHHINAFTILDADASSLRR